MQSLTVKSHFQATCCLPHAVYSLLSTCLFWFGSPNFKPKAVHYMYLNEQSAPFFPVSVIEPSKKVRCQISDIARIDANAIHFG